MILATFSAGVSWWGIRAAQAELSDETESGEDGGGNAVAACGAVAGAADSCVADGKRSMECRTGLHGSHASMFGGEAKGSRVGGAVALNILLASNVRTGVGSVRRVRTAPACKSDVCQWRQLVKNNSQGNLRKSMGSPSSAQSGTSRSSSF